MSTRFIQGSPVDYQGRTDGTAVPTGYIGEVIESTVINASTLPATISTGYVVNRSLTLGVGIYLIAGYVSIGDFNGAPGLFIAATGGTAGGTYAMFNSVQVTTNSIPYAHLSVIATITTAGTVTLGATSAGGSLSGTVNIAGVWRATRIA